MSTSGSTTAIAVFTRDLRLEDNPVLDAASHADLVVPLFVLDDAIFASGFAAPPRTGFLAESLADLDAGLRRLGAGLVVRRGRFVDEVCRIAEQVGAVDVHMATDASGYAQSRQARLAAGLTAQRRVLHLHEQVHTVVEPGSVTPAGGKHFAVFTPYFRRWADAPRRPLIEAPTRLRLPDIDRGTLPETASQGSKSIASTALPGGETAGRRRALGWLAKGIHDYADVHDDLAADATSRLSPYLHFGCVSATELVSRAERSTPSEGAEAFLRQLAWRDFHHQVLAARPETAREDYRSRDDAWREDPIALEAWQEGHTGIPIVDAGMRQLLAEGWMHNRARLITASFLTKSLYIDWRAGAAHFAEHLLDGDVANNNLNWQWVAGTGTDSRPNRVLNPLRQATRYDPSGEYVRRYVPDLGGRGYPAPIVDLADARGRFLAARAARTPAG